MRAERARSRQCPSSGRCEVFEEEVHLVGVERVEVNAFVDAATTVTLFRGVLGGAGEVRRTWGCGAGLR